MTKILKRNLQQEFATFHNLSKYSKSVDLLSPGSLSAPFGRKPSLIHYLFYCWSFRLMLQIFCCGFSTVTDFCHGFLSGLKLYQHFICEISNNGEKNSFSCTPAWEDPANNGYTWYLMIVGFLIPLLIFLFTSISAIYNLYLVFYLGQINRPNCNWPK